MNDFLWKLSKQLIQQNALQEAVFVLVLVLLGSVQTHLVQSYNFVIS